MNVLSSFNEIFKFASFGPTKQLNGKEDEISSNLVTSTFVSLSSFTNIFNPDAK